MDEKKKILVTGGAGLIGFEVCRQLHNMGQEVRLFDLGEQIIRMKKFIPEGVKIFYGSILDTASLRTAMAGCDYVVHLAALMGVQRSEAEKLRCIEVNVDGTKNVLECAVSYRIKKIVFSSSSEVYGEPLENPITEETSTQGKTVYGITKLIGEEICKGYSQKYPIKFSILRYFNCYGPFQAAQFVIAKFVSNVMNGKPPIIYGGGKQIRSHTYVSDTARATILALFNDSADGQVINIGNGERPIDSIELANLVIKIGGKEAVIKPEYCQDFVGSDRTKEREIFFRYCNAEKARKLLGWKPEVSLEQGIKKVFDAGTIFDNWQNVYSDEQN